MMETTKPMEPIKYITVVTPSISANSSSTVSSPRIWIGGTTNVPCTAPNIPLEYFKFFDEVKPSAKPAPDEPAPLLERNQSRKMRLQEEEEKG